MKSSSGLATMNHNQIFGTDNIKTMDEITEELKFFKEFLQKF